MIAIQAPATATPVRVGARKALTERATVIEEAYELLDGERWVSWIETPLGASNPIRTPSPCR